MKICPECRLTFKEEYQFCSEDGAPLAASPSAIRLKASASVLSKTAGVVVLDCPACTTDKPLMFSECLVQHRSLATPRILSWAEPQGGPRLPRKIETRTENTLDEGWLHPPSIHRPPTALQQYEEMLESLIQPEAAEITPDRKYSLGGVSIPKNGDRKYRAAAIVISITLAGLALIGIRLVISQRTRLPVPSAIKGTSAKVNPMPSPTPIQPPISSPASPVLPTSKPAPPPTRRQEPPPQVPVQRRRTSSTPQKRSPANARKARPRVLIHQKEAKPSRHGAKTVSPRGGKRVAKAQPLAHHRTKPSKRPRR